MGDNVPQLVVLPLAFPPRSLGLGEFGSDWARVWQMDAESWEQSRSFVGVPQHHAIDLIVPRGVIIIAATAGEVIDAGWDYNWASGWNVMIQATGKSGDKYWFHYAHMIAEPAVKRGDRVNAGQVLGLVGNTGGGRKVPQGTMSAGPPHLHFAMYRDGRDPINPWDQLVKLSKQAGDRHYTTNHSPNGEADYFAGALGYVIGLTKEQQEQANRPITGEEALGWLKHERAWQSHNLKEAP